MARAARSLVNSSDVAKFVDWCSRNVDDQSRRRASADLRGRQFGDLINLTDEILTRLENLAADRELLLRRNIYLEELFERRTGDAGAWRAMAGADVRAGSVATAAGFASPTERQTTPGDDQPSGDDK